MILKAHSHAKESAASVNGPYLNTYQQANDMIE